MDRRLKERLIGASILVILAVLFIPELLSGPSRPRAAPAVRHESSPVRTYTLEVGSAASVAPPPVPATGSSVGPGTAAVNGAAASNASAATMTAAAPKPAAAPTDVAAVPGANDEAAALRAPASSPAARALASAPRTALGAGEMPESPGLAAVAAKPANGSWSIQLGSFSSAGNAERLVREVRSKGFKAYVSSVGRGSKARHRVRVGPFPDRASAERAVAPLRARGHSGAMVRP